MAIKEHLNDEALAQCVREAVCLEQQRRWQTIYLRQTQPGMPVKNVAHACGVAYRTVTQWTWGYKKHGPQWLEIKPRGGRRHGLMTPEQEATFMDEMHASMHEASHVTAAKIKTAAEQRLGRGLPKDYAYDLLWRHGWRKVMPRTHHPKGDPQAREDFKKNFRKYWKPPEKP
jgi:transposase